MFKLIRSLWAGGSAVFISAALVLDAFGSDRNSSCIACHRTIEGVSYLEHNLIDWEHSVHAKAGVNCEACHGGNPLQKDKEAAHAGLKPSTDPDSPVYFTRIPATCGACHQAEYKAFQKSAHYRQLERSGRGPNCVSCHGSMANHVLAPRDLEMSCILCHQQPTKARATILALTHAGSSLKRLERALTEARAKRVDVATQERAYRDARELHRRALEDWHTFRLSEVLKSSQEVTRQAATALNEVRLKEQQQKP